MGNMELPSWHGDVLQQRDANRQQGNDEPINWEEAKQELLTTVIPECFYRESSSDSE